MYLYLLSCATYHAHASALYRNRQSYRHC